MKHRLEHPGILVPTGGRRGPGTNHLWTPRDECIVLASAQFKNVGPSVPPQQRTEHPWSLSWILHVKEKVSPS